MSLARCPLTHLPNRLLLQEHTRMALNRARRNDRQVAMLHVGLDDFGLVNDRPGRQAGERVLREVARRMEGRSRTCSCWGGSRATSSPR